MAQVTDVSYRLGKSKDPRYCEVIAKFKYKGKRREYYIFVKKNDRYKPNTYLKAAQKQFEIDLKNGKVADAYMRKAPLIVLATAFAATAIVFGALIVKRYISQHEGITFDVGNDATLELYDEKQISFPIQAGGVTWDNFYKGHRYFGAVKNGYDFLYWSLDGKNPIDNNYLFTKPTKLVPVFHENTDGVSFIIRHIPSNVKPDFSTSVDYEINDSTYQDGNIKFRKNYGEWETYSQKTSDTNFDHVGEVISFKTIDSYTSNKFTVNNKDLLILAVSGDTKSLVGGKDYKENAFSYNNIGAFRGAKIHSAGGLVISGNELPRLCCANMFGESLIVIPPQLTVSKVGESSCQNMFTDCKSLLVAPDLPATTLGVSCYQNMFMRCESLIKAPAILPAMTLEANCYYGMFTICESLLVAPDLPATTLGVSCYQSMFIRCKSLIKAPAILPATTLEANCYHGMFTDCTSLVKAPTLPATVTVYCCYTQMFMGCTSLTNVSDLPATERYEVGDDYIRIGEPKVGLADSCYMGMFRGCSSLASSPYIQATSLELDEHNTQQLTFMFFECSNLSSIKIKYTGSFENNDPFLAWVSGVSSAGTFYYNGSDTTRGPSAIPEGWTIKKF